MVAYWWRLALVLLATILVAREPAFVKARQAPGAPIAAPTGAPTGNVTLRIIVTSAADEAERIVEQLRQGGSFADLARKVSIDPSADSGGLLGSMALSALRSELRRAVQGLGAGQLTPVIQVPTGFAVVQVVPDAEAEATASATPGPAVAATGSVKYVLAVAGLVEAQPACAGSPSRRIGARIRA